MRFDLDMKAAYRNVRRTAAGLPGAVQESVSGSRKTLIRAGVSLALIVPAGAMMAAGRYDQVKTEAAEVGSGPMAEDPVVSAAWQEQLLQRERVHIAANLAKRFDIDVELAQKIHVAASEYDIEPDVAFGLVRAESTFRTRAISPAGAVGLTQLMPATARWLKPGVTRAQLMDPEVNLQLGFRYLRDLIDQYNGDTRLALTAYNRGPGTVAKQLRAGRDPDNGYADMVLTGTSKKHVALMNQKFGGRRR
jgi:hypothetical protein